MYNSADALLQKASLQLRGQWPSTKQDDLQDYLNSLNRKANVNSVKFKDMSDISMSSDDVEIEFARSSDDDDDVDDTDWRKNKFFKQPTHFDMPQPKTVPNSPFVNSSAFPQKGPASSVLRPGGISVPLTGGRSVSQTSSALDRASALVQKIERRVSGAEPRPKSAMRISFNIDSDEELKGHQKDAENSNDSDSEKKKKSGRRFLKKPKPEEPAKTKEVIQDGSEKPKPEKIPDSVLERRNSLMLSTSIVLSSDDESMAEFIGKLSLPDTPPVQKDPVPRQGGKLSRTSSMERKPSILKRSPSPRQIHSPSPSLRNQSSRSPSPAFAARTLKHFQSVTEDLTLAESLPAEIVEEEPLEENDEADPSKSTEKDFKFSVFNVEDLGSSFRASEKKNKTEKTKREKEKSPRKKSHHSKPSGHSSRKSSQHSSRPSSRHSSRHSSRPSSRNSSIMEEIQSKEHKIFSSFGLQTVDDLLPRTPLLPSQHRSVSFDTGSLKVTSSHHEESVTEVMSEIHTQRSVTPSSRKHSSHSSVTDAYSEDFVSANISESDRNGYTEDFHTVSDMRTTTLSHDTYLSATNTDMSSYESSKRKGKHRSKKSRRRASTPKVIRVCNEGTQTNELDFIHAQLEASPWNSLYANQDWKGRPLMTGTTKPVISAAPHTCGQACLNAHLPSQSNLVAVHEIMKQQLEFTRHFCESQKYLYHSLVEALTPDYVYTTLEATKEYIKKHRKPKLTMKKALEMVELEMQS